jgi:hypothetical protein
MGRYEGITGTALPDDSRKYRSALFFENAMKDRLMRRSFGK